MKSFLKLADGVDVLPLYMAVARQADGLFQEHNVVSLFAEGEWQGEYYAFPQIRGLLLDLMRRVEAGQLHSVWLANITEEFKINALPDSSKALALLPLGDFTAQSAGEGFNLTVTSVVFSTAAADVHVTGSGVLLGIVFSPMP